jgi:cytoskeletal protein CcmA (bactofilin family)
MAIGRISGPLLKANLIRNGVDLAFETDLLYIDVNNNRIGINNASPSTDLDVNGTTRSTTLTVDNQLDIGNLTITGNTVSSTINTISFAPSGDDPVVYHSVLDVDDIRITGNTVSTTNSNSNLELKPNGSGTLELQSSTNITGDLYVTGNVNADGNVTIGGNITIGDSLTDEIQFVGSIKSDLIPESDNTYDLGSSSFRWKTAYVNDLFADTLNVPTLDIGDISIRDNEITTGTGLDLYINGNGTGGVRLGNFKIVDNVITNVSNNAITQIGQTGTGYFKIDTTNGFVPPRGTDAERPTAYAVLGMTRYNTNSKALEVWDGTAWASPAGATGAVSEIVANDIAASFALMLG